MLFLLILSAREWSAEWRRRMFWPAGCRFRSGAAVSGASSSSREWKVKGFERNGTGESTELPAFFGDLSENDSLIKSLMTLVDNLAPRDKLKQTTFILKRKLAGHDLPRCTHYIFWMRDDGYRDNIRHADQSQSRLADGTAWPTPSKSGTSTSLPSYMRYSTGATLPRLGSMPRKRKEASETIYYRLHRSSEKH